MGAQQNQFHTAASLMWLHQFRGSVVGMIFTFTTNFYLQCFLYILALLLVLLIFS
jgi:hypothetical protein